MLYEDGVRVEPYVFKQDYTFRVTEDNEVPAKFGLMGLN